MSETSIKKRPGTARSIVSEFKGCAVINPSPVEPEDTRHTVLELCLTPEKLKVLSGSDNLQEVTSLEMCVDTQKISLDNFGAYLPKLKQLKMNNSLVLSVRNLGTRLSQLQVLWLAHCGVTELDGISCLLSLKELYLAYNNISELIQLSMLEHLELLDLERNDVSDLFQVWHLGNCKKLRTLTLEGNPVCTCPSTGALEQTEYSYRSAVRERIPQLSFLDDVPVEEDKSECCTSTLTDWTLLKESIKDCFINDRLEYTDTDERSVSVCGIRPGSAPHISLGLSSSSLSSRPGSTRPLTSCSGSRPGSANSNLCITLDHEISDLTNGFGGVLCGNPLQAVRAQRQKETVQISRSQTRPSTRLSSYIPEHTYDNEQPSSQERSDVFAELRNWRIEHNKRLLAIEEDRQPQIMKILHSDDDDDEGSHNYSFISDDITRDEEQEKRIAWRDVTSDSSIQSFSPDLLHQESQEVPRLTSISDSTISPSPPLKAVAPGGRRITPIRARRLRPHNGEIFVPRPPEDTPNSSFGLRSTMTVKTVPPQILHKPCRPSTSHGVSPLRSETSEDTGNDQKSDNQHKPVIHSNTSYRSSTQLQPTRPRTARAALQRLPNRTLLPDRGNGLLK